MGQGNTEKVPTRISYGVPPKIDIQWGNLIKPTTKAYVHALMKLKLDERLKQSKQLKVLLAFLTSNFDGLDLDDLDSGDEDGPPAYPGKDPVDLVADYLTEVRKHVWQELATQYGESMFESLRKELVVTVPAVWSERAKDLTLKAVTKAKFDAAKISLVTEPEAAAVYTLKGMTEGASKEDVKVCLVSWTSHGSCHLMKRISRSVITLSSVTLAEAQSISSPTRSHKRLQHSKWRKQQSEVGINAVPHMLTR